MNRGVVFRIMKWIGSITNRWSGNKPSLLPLLGEDRESDGDRT